MNPKVLVPIMLAIFFTGSVAVFGQEGNQRKIDRMERKIEKQTKKLHELRGNQYFVYGRKAPVMQPRQIEGYRLQASAQAEEAREQMREAMESQREAMESQREAMRDQKREMEKSMIIIRDKNAKKYQEFKELNLDKLKELEGMDIEVLKDTDGEKIVYGYKTPKFQWKSNEPMVVDVPGVRSGVFNYFENSQDNLNINKALSDESNTADFTYEVKEGAKGMSVFVEGKMDAGKVQITIKRPDGEVFNEYTLSSLANVNWHQNLAFDDMEDAQYVGKWIVTIVAEKATGTYNLNLKGR